MDTARRRRVLKRKADTIPLIKKAKNTSESKASFFISKVLPIFLQDKLEKCEKILYTKEKEEGMRIAIFGGSFNPVHNEHIRMAKCAAVELSLDTLYVMPAHTPPHKQGKWLAPNEERLKACEIAFAGEENVVVSDYEIRQGGTSYTYLTCRHFRSLYPSAEIFWLVGTDMLRDFPTWKNPEDILSNVTLCVCGRAEQSDWVDEENKKFYKRFGKKFLTISYMGKDVSSTKIRVLLGAGMDASEFLDENVERYIKEKGTYAVPFAKEALALQTEKRRAHSIRVALTAVERAKGLKIPEDKALLASLMHDCAKNLPKDSPYLQGFIMPTEWGDVPGEVAHQFLGAYVAKTHFFVDDEDVVNAIRFHTSARPNMSELEKLIFLADMVEEERRYDGVERLRALFWEGENLDECLALALKETLAFLEKKGGEIYPLTSLACEYYNN